MKLAFKIFKSDKIGKKVQDTFPPFSFCSMTYKYLWMRIATY